MKASTGPAVCIERGAEMISPYPDNLRQNVEYEDATKMQSLQAGIRREERASRVTVKPFSLWVLVVCGVTIFFTGFFWSRSGSSYSGAPHRAGASQSEADLKAIAPPVNARAVDQSTVANASVSAIVHVVMHDMKFSPASVEIKPGQTVEWTNQDITPHTATSSPSFDSGSIDSDKSWRHTFTEPGNFPYICTFHPEMKAVVTVK